MAFIAIQQNALGCGTWANRIEASQEKKSYIQKRKEERDYATLAWKVVSITSTLCQQY